MLGRWMRRIRPFPHAALFVLVAIAVVAYFDGLTELQQNQINGMYPFGMLLALIYGIMRAGHFFPNERNDYGKWLATTPWRGPQQLPFGTVHLVPQDAVVPAVYIAASWWLTASFALGITMVLTAIIAYYIGIALACGSKRSGWAGYAIMLCLAFAMAFAFTPWLALIFLLPCELFARWGIANSLRQFPEWSGQLDDEQRLPPEWLKRDGRRIQPTLGWPYGSIHPVALPERTPLWKLALLALQFGIWIWAFIHMSGTFIATFSPADPEVVETFLIAFYPAIIAFGCLCAVPRIALSLMALRPSLTLWGRLATGRLILPSYDRLFLVPILILAVSVGLTMLGFQLQLSPEWYVPASVMILTMIAFTVGQSMTEWRLTAACRLTPGWMGNNQSLLETK